MDQQPVNPYMNLMAIRNAAEFFGQKHQFESFYELLVSRLSVSLTGVRQIGKSSFLWCSCLTELQAEYNCDLRYHIFVPLDLREYVYRTDEAFFRYVSKEIIRQSRVSHDLELLSREKNQEEFSDLLDQIQEQGYYLVLLLDSFDSVTRNEHFRPEFFSFLRSHAVAGKVSYVTASIAPLYELCHKDIVDSPFFNIFVDFPLEALTIDEARELIHIPAERSRQPFTEEEAQWAMKYAGLHPFFLQRACFVLFREKQRSSSDKVTEQQFRTKAYRDLLPTFKDIWERLSESQRTEIRDEVQQIELQSRVYPELTESYLLRQFVRNVCQIGLFKMKEIELEKALDKVNDLAALGETDLRLMKSVARRLQSETLPMAVERGKAIREVLFEALEGLRGPGIQEDTKPEWMYYNILYYRYFLSPARLRHKDIIAHLQFIGSDRQYFRKHGDAVKALLNKLFEMESVEKDLLVS
jgi:Novel STAND NTPase 2